MQFTRRAGFSPSFRAKSAERGISLRPALAQSISTKWLILSLVSVVFPYRINAQQNSSLAASIQKVIDRPEFKHANFGIEFYDLATGAIVSSLNADKLFTPSSTTSLLPDRTLLATLGNYYRSP